MSPGYYWVRLKYAGSHVGDWEVAKLDSKTGLWYRFFDTDEYNDDDFAVVDDTAIDVGEPRGSSVRVVERKAYNPDSHPNYSLKYGFIKKA